MPNNAVMPKITIGADPELFVRHLGTGQIVSAHDLLPGTKMKPHEVTNGAIQVDGVAAEFNILPAPTSDHFVAYCGAVMHELRIRLGNRYELVIEPTAHFEQAYFETLPVNTRELGCNPDFNAWTGQVNEPPSTPPGDTVMRTAAGHIHIGWTTKQDVKDHDVFADCCVVARQMDYYLGVFSLLWDPDPTRRLMYGKAGSFRPKPYGIEYRPLSNLWLLTPMLQQWVYLATYQGLQALFSGHAAESRFGDLARTIIDENQVDWITSPEAKKIYPHLGMNRPPVPVLPTISTKKPRKAPDHSYGNPPVGTISLDHWFGGQ